MCEEWQKAGEMPVIDYGELDSGIREIVRKVNEAGFETTDSGDGVSKPANWYTSGEAMPFKHVAVTTVPDRMVEDAKRLSGVLGPEWEVEATFSTQSNHAYLFARDIE